MDFKTKSLFLLIIFSFTVQGFCCDCNPACSGCAVCEDGECVPDDDQCQTDCYEDCQMEDATTGSCEWSCGLDEMCCDGECCVGCCFGDCCETTNNCCNGQCCDNECCNRVCCEDPDAECCASECCSNECCYNTCCESGESCCGIQCCQGECCAGVFCCSKTGKVCCNNVSCYDSSEEQCCDDGTICDNEDECCNGACCTGGLECCDGLVCYNPSMKKCCERGDGSVCNVGEECCDDGTCQDQYDGCCWQLEEHPEGSGTCACNWSTEHCGEFIEAWSISTCVRATSGAEFCTIEYRQVGSKYGCVETTDWTGAFLCYGGSYAICTALCAEMSALCVGSGYEPDTCATALGFCLECFEDAGGENICNNCAMVDCDIGDVIEPIMDNAGTLSGNSCPD